MVKAGSMGPLTEGHDIDHVSRSSRWLKSKLNFRNTRSDKFRQYLVNITCTYLRKAIKFWFERSLSID